METNAIIALIIALAPTYNIDPKTAVAVATVESGMNPRAIGGAGEIGLFQIMPEIARKKGFTRKQLQIPIINIAFGLEMLQFAKNNCVHRANNEWLVCYNYGARNALKIKHPHLFPYVRKVNAVLKNRNLYARN